ncbi:16S rRNA (cytidine(1402)-2'-O)-methyltransferase [Spiractinospora alimapuensis]|uniref:16S rRNA (cytidine(1402)-2'-O)-methyltransferase n=1 Tax=Spiractinospora alimapuensis TaxID=2820884 RepID=UPI001EEC478B|nr:16S rRNA (cytidine(1402)-2'-O)-methyltransferase [Spiractinospora alimapuensis]QVQ51387.1 16S rRNA (cytidine(1402)-2'-O)-methyltransferase [Spiractinospora alimapuensis]
MAEHTDIGASGRLTLAGMPIGQPLDASPRLRVALEDSPIIAAEDTRRLRRLASELKLDIGRARVLSYFEGNERGRAPQLLEELKQGVDVLLVTDAGMPGVSDPGYRLVAGCVQADIPVTVIPGPSAVTAALAVSGLPTDRFCFEGFPPRKGQARRFEALAREPRTMVFFESPRRLGPTLDAMATAFGPNRSAVVCRELTKTFEEVRRGSLAELATWAHEGVRGEITLVVAGDTGEERGPVTVEALAKAVAEREEEGTHRKQAIAEVAKETGVPKREVYDAVHKG